MALLTLIIVICEILVLSLFSFQNAFSVAAVGKVSIRIAMVWPLPVTVRPSAP